MFLKIFAKITENHGKALLSTGIVMIVQLVTNRFGFFSDSCISSESGGFQFLLIVSSQRSPRCNEQDEKTAFVKRPLVVRWFRV